MSTDNPVQGLTPDQIKALDQTRGVINDDVDRCTHQLNLVITELVLRNGFTTTIQPTLASLSDLDDSLLEAVADRYRQQGWCVEWYLADNVGASIYNHYKFIIALD